MYPGFDFGYSSFLGDGEHSRCLQTHEALQRLETSDNWQGAIHIYIFPFRKKTLIFIL